MSTQEKLLREWILPKTVESGCFGKNAELENFIIDEAGKTMQQFASQVIFVKLYIKLKDKIESEVHDVVIKLELENEAFRNMVNATMQFRNELLMYSTLLPLLDKNDVVPEVFCKYYYGFIDPDDPSKDFIVLEDLRKYGYTTCVQQVFLDYDHCVLVMEQLGKFHALSYMAKPDKLNSLLSATSKIEEKWTKESFKNFNEMFKICGKRGLQPLIDEGVSVDLLSCMSNEFDYPGELFEKLIAPVEPEAVLCHGDFNLNNVLFKYDANLKPIGIKFIDLQTPRYSSPVIDLSFFIFMNTTHLLRKKHLNDLLDTYKQSILTTVNNSCAVPSLDFGRVGIYGYFHCCFFLPVMLTKNENNHDLSDILITDPEKCAKRNSERGGESATKVLVDIIKDLLEFGYIRKLPN